MKLKCKYCGEDIEAEVDHEAFEHLQGLISHPQCYEANKQKKLEAFL